MEAEPRTKPGAAADRDRASRLTLVVAAVLCLAGCITLRPLSGEAPPVDTAEPTMAEPTASDLRARLDQRAKALATFRGQARLEYKGDEQTRRYSQMIVVKAPDRLRIDFMNPFGPSYTVATDGNRLIAFDRGEKILYQGLPSVRNLRRYTRVPIEIGVLAALMRGMPPLLERAAHAEVSRSDDGWLWETTVKGGGRMSVVFDAETMNPTTVTIQGAVLAGDIQASFAGYRSVDDFSVPHLVRVRLPDGTRVELRYSRIWRGLTLRDSAFRLEPPSGVTVVDMEEEWLREASD